MQVQIHALHPDPTKQGTNINRVKYESIKNAILGTLQDHDGEVLFRNLPDEVGKRLRDFDGSVGWYTTTVKLDLEARGLIERVPNVSPQKLRFVQRI